jgi:hypothetical protein
MFESLEKRGNNSFSPIPCDFIILIFSYEKVDDCDYENTKVEKLHLVVLPVPLRFM